MRLLASFRSPLSPVGHSQYCVRHVPSFRGPKDHITQGSHIMVPRPNTKRITESMVCGILRCRWSFGPLSLLGTVGVVGYPHDVA